MKIEVIEIRDLPEGGAEIIIDVDDEAKLMLINLGFITALESGIAKVKKLWDEEDKPNESDE